MSWRLAKSLDVLRKQINERYPARSKSSDGTIGDENHSSRSSDHNPNSSGVVCAMDITHDLRAGLDARQVAQALLDSRDDRIKYVISNGEICSGPDGPKPWVWRPYTGKNPHDKHFHLSVRGTARVYDQTIPWAIGDGEPVMTTEPPVRDAFPMLRQGVKGDSVALLQKLLNAKGAKLNEDGDFGAKTRAAVIKVQKEAKLVPDGIVGPYTWDAIKQS